MPIYEYRCEACGHQLEAMQKMSDAPLVICPACQQTTLKKLISAAGFQLKGGGWYVTDFRDKQKPKDGGGEGNKDKVADSATSKTGSETKTESQPDAKTETKTPAEPTPKSSGAVT